MAKLYPPDLGGVIPAFYGTTLVVPFSMNKAVSKGEVLGVSLKLKTVQSNTYLITQTTTNFTTDEAIFTFSNELSKKLSIGQFYKVQIAYVGIDGPGYYSTVGVVKYTSEPKVDIENLNKESGRINTHRYSYIGHYQQDIDTTERVYSYQFNLYDSNLNLIQTSGEQLHNSYNDTELYQSCDTYNIEQDLELNEIFYIEYVVKTINNLEISSGRYKITQKQSIDPEIQATLVPSLNFENGYIDLTLKGAINSNGIESSATGLYRVLRASNKDNYKTWHEILKFALYGQKPSSWIWKDFTVEQGVSYKYALQQYNENITSNRIESVEVYADFEHAFLYDGQRQLKIKYNPKVASFKNNVLETKTNTIGSKYPFISRNGNVKYKEFSISGLISCRSDEETLFYSSSEYDQTINLTSENIATERNFKLEVLEWLNNGEPKIYRSPSEGNYIVRLINVSMSPNDTVGRMLHTFTATAVEIEEFNYAGLETYNFIQITDPTVKQIRWETIKLDESKVNTNLLNYKAISLRFEGLVPGDKLTLVQENGKQIDIIIGATGSYEIDVSAGLVISSVQFTAIEESKARRYQGILTYAFYGDIKNRFSSIDNIEIYDVPLQQFIGETDVFKEIQDIKNQIQGFYQITATKRELYNLYFDDGIYYQDVAHTEIFKSYEDYAIYAIYDENKDKLFYWDNFAYKNDSNYAGSESYEPYIYFNDETICMDLTEIYMFTINDLQDLQSLKIGNGVMLEVSYQKQSIEYSVESSNKYENITEWKKEVNNIHEELSKVIFKETGIGENTKEDEVYILASIREEYQAAYQKYIEEVTNALEKEEAIQGDIAR